MRRVHIFLELRIASARRRKEKNKTRFPFLASRFGRALTYVFIGSLAFVLGVKFARKYDSWYTCVAGGYQMAAGCLLFTSYLCASSGDAGEYNAYRHLPGEPV